ncbi:hypothetical protein Scep_005969 [Stephania cephalantha]|uniref:Uncharacterized protein n=1 Tax=Stephania cephalantha TaxID=152367 RepID=A0AAP0K9M2_9MAGN
MSILQPKFPLLQLVRFVIQTALPTPSASSQTPASTDRCGGCWWGIGVVGGSNHGTHPSGGDGKSLPLHIVGGYLGWQWRRVRTIQDQINNLKKQLKPAEGGDASSSPSPLESQIQQLTEERKQLVKGSYRDRHFNAGSILLGFGVFEAIGGGVNTWFRTGKLFPGPHLFAGAAITVLWAAAAALVPSMQKGSEAARNLHIAFNTLNVLLFIWQIPTGIDIVFKVFEFTKWP